MNSFAKISKARLRGEILRSVSRSFYISLRLLPPGIHAPVATAYLLARATDTIADTGEVSAAIRKEQLQRLAGVIAGQLPPDEAASVREVFAPLQTNRSERALIEALPECMEWLGQLDREDRDDVQTVLAKINEGQALDVERFGDTEDIRALATVSELDRYIYLVAGCVGEFWTHVGSRRLPDFSDRADTEMIPLAIAYGKGLQLINVLRDLGADLLAGRCYLPQEQLAELGLAPAELLHRSEAAVPVLAFWRAKAKAGIAAGIDYACAIRNRRVRFATALPALIGARTLALLEAAGAKVFHQKVKVARSEVQKITWSGAMTFASARSIRQRFERLSESPK